MGPSLHEQNRRALLKLKDKIALFFELTGSGGEHNWGPYLRQDADNIMLREMANTMSKISKNIAEELESEQKENN